MNLSPEVDTSILYIDMCLEFLNLEGDLMAGRHTSCFDLPDRLPDQSILVLSRMKLVQEDVDTVLNIVGQFPHLVLPLLSR